MVVAVLRVDVHIPGARSLKEKRSAIKRAIANVRNNLKISCAEVGDHDLHQRAQLAACVVSNDEAVCEEVLAQVLALLEQGGNLYVLGEDWELIRM